MKPNPLLSLVGVGLLGVTGLTIFFFFMLWICDCNRKPITRFLTWSTIVVLTAAAIFYGKRVIPN